MIGHHDAHQFGSPGNRQRVVAYGGRLDGEFRLEYRTSYAPGHEVLVDSIQHRQRLICEVYRYVGRIRRRCGFDNYWAKDMYEEFHVYEFAGYAAGFNRREFREMRTAATTVATAPPAPA
jgi:hypothetical protein